MRRLSRFLARLYPPAWRDRYEVEFAALLEDVNPNWRTSLDILKGALAMRLRIWNAGTTLAIAGVIGAVAALGLSFALPRSYVSEAAVKIYPPAGAAPAASQATIDYLNRLSERVRSRTSLVTIISTYNLYKDERRKMPVEDVIRVMQKNVSVLPLGKTTPPEAFLVRFMYGDAVTAQKVTQDLVARFIDENVLGPHDGRGMNLELLNPASLPRNPVRPKRPEFAIVGLAAGLAMGAIVAWFRRRPNPAKVSSSE